MPRIASLTSRALTGLGLSFGPNTIPYPTNIDPFDQIIKLADYYDSSQYDWHMRRSDGNETYTGIITTASPGFYGTTDSVFRPQAAAGLSWGPSSASFTPEYSNQIFTGENGAWSVEWIGRHNYNAPGEIREITVLGQTFGVGWTVTLQVLNSIDNWRILVGTSDIGGNTGQSFTVPITTYTNDTWAHFVVAWQPASATTGRLYVRVNGVLQSGFNNLLTKPAGEDFYRRSGTGTAIFKVLTAAQLLNTDFADFRLMSTATPWIGTGSAVMALPTNPFNQNLYLFSAQINNPNTNTTNAADSFGISIGVSGNEITPIFVGAYTEDDASNTNTGVVHEYRAPFGRDLWSRFRTLANPNAFGTPANDLFGDSVVANATSIFASATAEEGPTGTSANSRVYIITRSTGSLTATINNPQPTRSGGAETVNFGTTLRLNPSGTRLVVGAPNNISSITSTGDGVVYIYDTSGNPGGPLTTIDCPVNSYTGGENFGRSIDVSDTHIIIGQEGYSANLTDSLRQGRAYIYGLATGNLVHTLENPDQFGTKAEDAFGRAVAISSQYAAVAAPGEDDDLGVNVGQVSVYDVTSGTRLYTLGPSVTRYSNLNNGGEFGTSLAIVGDRLFISEPAKALYTDNGFTTGMIHIYEVSTGQHIQTINTTQQFGGLTLTVNSNGSMLISGNPQGLSGQGDIRIYDRL